MRIDKYLKVSRIIKRRTLAHEASSNELVFINDKKAKPSSSVKVGDIIKINYSSKILVVKVKSIQSSTKKDDALEMYEIIKIEEIGEENGN